MKEDLKQISSFLKITPENLTKAYKTTDFLKLANNYPAFTSTGKKVTMEELFLKTAETVFIACNKVASDIDEALKNEKNLKDTYLKLENVGLTSNSLEIKGSVLTALWFKFDQFQSKGLKSFTNITLRELFKSCLEYLSDFLGSLKSVFPSLEVLKEFVEMMRGILDLINE
jgi:hypothetical protein